MDVYDEARAFPSTLRGDRAFAVAPDLYRDGQTKDRLSWRARRGRISHPHRGVYTAGRAEPDLLDTVRAALLVCPPQAVLGYHTAATLLGFGVIASENVHVVVPAGTAFPQRRGITVHQSVIPMDAPTDVLEVPCTSAARCAVDLARALRRRDAPGDARRGAA